MAQRTAMFGKKASPGGLFTIEDMSRSTGNRWFVDSGAANGGDTAGHGKSPDAPFLTLAYGFSGNGPTASNGDIIYVMPGHAESISAALGMVMDLAGVQVVGLGEGDNRPVITFDTAATADLDIDAANITIENITFRCNIADLAAAIDVNAANFTLRNCSFMGTDAADEAFLISVITDAAANDMTIEDCQFHYLYAADGTTGITTTSTECIRLVGADRAVIKNNYMSGDFTTAAINGVTTASLDVLLLDNLVHNIATENITGGIDLYSGTTGFLDLNTLYVDDPTSADDIIDAASCAIGRNFVTNAAGTAPIVWGTAGSGGVEGKIDALTVTLAAQNVAQGQQVRKTAEFAVGAGTGSIGTFALFTVTGAVRFSIVATCSDTLVGAATLECGVTGTTAGIIAQIADATTLAAGEIWADATPTLKLDTLANSQLDFVIGDGEDIFLTIGAANLTDGTVDFNVIWWPLSATGNIVAA